MLSLFTYTSYHFDAIAYEERIDGWLGAAETSVERHRRLCAATAEHIVFPRLGDIFVEDAEVLEVGKRISLNNRYSLRNLYLRDGPAGGQY